jgi:hypothetical protein
MTKDKNDLIWTGSGFVKRSTLDVLPKKKKQLSKKQKRKLEQEKKDKTKYMEDFYGKQQKRADRGKKWYGK